MQCQQVQLLRRLDRHEAHGRPLHGFRYRLGVAVVVLVPLEEWFDVLRRDQPDVMADLTSSIASKTDIARTYRDFRVVPITVVRPVSLDAKVAGEAARR